MSGDTEKNGRIEYLREDLQHMRQEMLSGFEVLSQKVDENRVRLENENKSMLKVCSQKRGDIYQRLGSLETKTFRLFLIGNGIGFLIGVAVTTIAQSYFSG